MDDDVLIEDILSAGNILLLDLIYQIDCIVSENDFSQEKDRPTAKERSITSSVLIMSFAILETYTNFLSELIIKENTKSNPSPSIIYQLSIIEIDALKEQSSYLDTKSIEVKRRNNVYMPILNKLIVTSKLLAKAYGKEITFDKGGNEWKYIMKLKDRRDEITHPKFNSNNINQCMEKLGDLKKMTPSFNIPPEDILNGLIGVRWYLELNGKLLISIFNGKFNSSTLNAMDLILHNIILKTNKIYNVHNQPSFEKKLLPAITFEECYSEKFIAALSHMTSGLENSK